MKNRKKEDMGDFVSFKYGAHFNNMEIIMEEKFVLWKGQFYLNTNPYGNQRLAAIETLSVEKDKLQFSIASGKKVENYDITLRSDIDRELAGLISLFHTSPYEPSKERTYDLSYQLENGLSRLSWNLDEDNGEIDDAWLMTGRKQGDAFIIVYPEPFRWNSLKTLSLDDDRLSVQWEKLDPEEPGDQQGSYEWEISVPSEIELLTKLCIHRCIEGIGKIN